VSGLSEVLSMSSSKISTSLTIDYVAALPSSRDVVLLPIGSYAELGCLYA